MSETGGLVQFQLGAQVSYFTELPADDVGQFCCADQSANALPDPPSPGRLLAALLQTIATDPFLCRLLGK